MHFPLKIRNSAIAAITGLTVSSVQAADQTWTGATNSVWDNSTPNWSGGVFANYDTATFGAQGVGAITVATGVSSGDIRFNASGYSFSGDTLTLATGPTGTGGDVKIYAAGGTTNTIANYFTYTNSNSLYLGATDFQSDWDGTINFTGGGDSGGIDGTHGARDIYAGFYNNSTLNFQAGVYSANGFFALSNLNVGAATLNTGFFRTAGNGNTFHMTDANSILNVANDFGVDSMIVGGNNNSSTLQLSQGTINSAGGVLIVDVTDPNTSSPNTGTLLVEGGTLNIAGTEGITLIRGQTTNPNGTAVFTVTGGVVNTPAIKFGSGSIAGQGTSATVNIQGGSVYVGSGGIVKTAFAAPSNTFNLSGGTLGASADWTSSVDFALSNANGGITIKAAGADDVGHNITLSGVISGPGTLAKAGSGTLTISGANTYQGGTIVNAGTVIVTSGGNLGTGDVTLIPGASLTLQSFAAIGDFSKLSFDSTSTITLDFTGSETVGLLWDSTTNQYALPSTYTAAELNTLFGVSTFSGSGSLTVTAVPEPATMGLVVAGLSVAVFSMRRRRTALRQIS
jgi:autotransporter-associated beta strand protein